MNRKELCRFPHRTFRPYMHWTSVEYHRYANEPPGREHYALLTYLAKQLQPGQYAADIGTNVGTSAFALACTGSEHEVHTFDTKHSDQWENTLEQVVCSAQF